MQGRAPHAHESFGTFEKCITPKIVEEVFSSEFQDFHVYTEPQNRDLSDILYILADTSFHVIRTCVS